MLQDRSAREYSFSHCRYLPTPDEASFRVSCRWLVSAWSPTQATWLQKRRVLAISPRTSTRVLERNYQRTGSGRSEAHPGLCPRTQQGCSISWTHLISTSLDSKAERWLLALLVNLKTRRLCTSHHLQSSRSYALALLNRQARKNKQRNLAPELQASPVLNKVVPTCILCQPAMVTPLPCLVTEIYA